MELPAKVLLDAKVQWGFQLLTGWGSEEHDILVLTELKNLRLFVSNMKSSPQPTVTITEAVRLCYITVQMVSHPRELLHEDSSAEELRQLLDALTQTCRAVCSSSAVELDAATRLENQLLAENCLRSIQRLELANLAFDAYEDNEAGYATWLASFKPEHSAFDDSFIEVLVNIYGDFEDARKFYRARRIQEWQIPTTRSL